MNTPTRSAVIGVALTAAALAGSTTGPAAATDLSEWTSTSVLPTTTAPNNLPPDETVPPPPSTAPVDPDGNTGNNLPPGETLPPEITAPIDPGANLPPGETVPPPPPTAPIDPDANQDDNLPPGETTPPPPASAPVDPDGNLPPGVTAPPEVTAPVDPDGNQPTNTPPTTTAPTEPGCVGICEPVQVTERPERDPEALNVCLSHAEPPADALPIGDYVVDYNQTDWWGSTRWTFEPCRPLDPPTTTVPDRAPTVGTVTPANIPAPTGQLPQTGNGWTIAFAAAVIAGLGVLFVLLARRDETETS
jgi:LPXTG-motif cell wall-anchored protein